MGFVGSKSGTSLFLLRVGTDLLLVLIYVDDIIITGNDSWVVTRLIHELGWEVLIKRPRSTAQFLGCRVSPYTLRSLSLSTEVHS